MSLQSYMSFKISSVRSGCSRFLVPTQIYANQSIQWYRYKADWTARLKSGNDGKSIGRRETRWEWNRWIFSRKFKFSVHSSALLKWIQIDWLQWLIPTRSRFLWWSVTLIKCCRWIRKKNSLQQEISVFGAVELTNDTKTKLSRSYELVF